ncbi:DNA endonuclease SmrA [Shewanella subflava]|uniref:DNA endonuclease SmrA n=1 Tax=Shewanella subflava TaxID=2986476 RepID=A0ABT3ICS3_9GAMM|nr:DNA endonuclease SmrA [Shewanella subflava]MCW3173852.1 DNA endonuclease SmrA [Shewanella subflava]
MERLDDDLLFSQEMADVKPLKENQKTQSNGLTAQITPTFGQLVKQAALNEHELLAMLPIAPFQFKTVSPDEVVEHRHDGMQEAVYKRLRQGKYDFKTILDLHSYSLQQARGSLVNCIFAAIERGERNILVIHGKGYHSKPYPGLMKSAVCHWLSVIEQVAAFHSATREQGGSGALFVLLKKSSQQRIENSELNRKGGGFR